MPTPALTKELQSSLRTAFANAATLRHEYVTLEHLLLALLSNPKTQTALQACGVNLENLKQAIEAYLEKHLEPVEGNIEMSPVPTMALDRVLQRAAIHVLSTDQAAIESPAVLVQMFKEPESYAVYLLEQRGVSEFMLKQYFSHGITSEEVDQPDALQRSENLDNADSDNETAPAPKKALERYCINLNEEAAKGRIDPLIGRQKELERLVQVLARRRKNNPVLIGDPGVGKTALIEGLALHIHERRVPNLLQNATVFALDMGTLLAGTKFRGQFEERLKAVMKALEEHTDAIVFIDEIHTIVGAGAVSGGSMDASNILKPALASGKIRCIGSTTFQEYKASFDRDRALARRFQTIEVEEPSVEETVDILKGLKKHYEAHHQVTMHDDALGAAAKLASVHINERFMPDKAIDVIDEAGAWVRLNMPQDHTQGNPPRPEVTVADVERVVSRMAKIPQRSVSAQDKSRLKDLASELKALIFGQDEAIDTLASQIKLSRAGLRSKEKPIGSFLFSGPTGVGKTELAKQLANTLGIEFIRFDMSEYSERHTVSRLIGAPPGYVGFDQGGLLTDAVRKHPHAVVVLDEIEKAHPDLFNLLLQVMDHATLTDNNGRKADFRHVILILTTNAGAFEMSAKAVGFGEGGKLDGQMDTSRAQKAIERTFTPEFRNRLDAWVIFQGLSKDVILKVVDKELALVQAQLNERNITLHVSENAKTWLADKGYDPTFGARPMARLVETAIKKPLAEVLLSDDLPSSVHVDLDAARNELVVRRAPTGA